jgi:type IV secretion system protein VirB5
MIRNLVRGLGPLLISAALLSSAPALAQGVPTVDLTSIAKIGEVLTEAKLQVKEMIASNLKLDEQILKQIEQIATLKAQLDALRNGLTWRPWASQTRTPSLTTSCPMWPI